MYFNLRYQKVCYHGAITFTVDGESILHDLWLHSRLRPQYFLRCELYVAYQATGHPNKLLPLQIFDYSTNCGF
uniref:Uncharacterized protein n=1 Tax=Lepeophtheirus salmonis TaxID=72036 RepID=A0A0K2UHF7_LEPSM